MRKQVSIDGPVRDLDALRLADEVNRVVTNDPAAAQRMNADFVLGAAPGLTLSAMNGLQATSGALSCLNQKRGRPAWRIHFLPMMGLDHLDIVRGSELLNGTLHEDGGDFSIPRQWRMAQVAQNMPETDETATAFVLAGDTRPTRATRPYSPTHSSPGTQAGASPVRRWPSSTWL